LKLNYTEFIDSLQQDSCPDQLEPCLQALWHDAAGDWHRAHGIVQQLDDNRAARIHAYLHRKEGDHWNARYWHRQAGTVYPEHLTLEQEWQSLARMFFKV
jgi:hypothetical protein